MTMWKLLGVWNRWGGRVAGVAQVPKRKGVEPNFSSFFLHSFFEKPKISLLNAVTGRKFNMEIHCTYFTNIPHYLNIFSLALYFGIGNCGRSFKIICKFIRENENPFERIYIYIPSIPFHIRCVLWWTSARRGIRRTRNVGLRLRCESPVPGIK